LSCVYIVCCLIVVSVLFVCCLIVVPLPPGENPFAVNNINNKLQNILNPIHKETDMKLVAFIK
jgi:hypothetical protein